MEMPYQINPGAMLYVAVNVIRKHDAMEVAVLECTLSDGSIVYDVDPGNGGSLLPMTSREAADRLFEQLLER